MKIYAFIMFSAIGFFIYTTLNGTIKETNFIKENCTKIEGTELLKNGCFKKVDGVAKKLTYDDIKNSLTLK